MSTKEQAHTADQAEMARELAEAKANEIYSSQLMRMFRCTLSNIRDGLEDEGDRIYLGSTNDAEELREIAEAIEELEWDRILASSQKKPDLYARIRELNTEVRALRSVQDELLAALKAMRTVMDSGSKPEKLDAALTWRECDEKARAMCDAVLAKVEGAAK